jgi:CBS domain-containing protein/gamma-glutamylcysteine synthetase
MGDLNVRIADNQLDLNEFTRYLLKDIQALELMLKKDCFDNEQMHIGAEQEICLVDDHGKPSATCLEVLEELNHGSFTTELARFNVECNLEPQPFKGDCFSKLEAETLSLLKELEKITKKRDIDYILTGILPTIRKFDLTTDNITPLDRYYALMNSLKKLRGKETYELKIEGIDELNTLHDTALVEACNTSFQVHLQIKPEEFVSKYNVAMAISAPILAAACNSPMLFGKRLWSETRIALFRQSIDTRIASEHLRERSPRVMFGNKWLKGSILDLYREDIMRFRVLLTTDIDEDAIKMVQEGKTPKLRALNVHNSTVYRWNRPCYGISPNGKPHLRIENRILPAGPTVVDEVANAALWIGAMNAFEDTYPDVTEIMEFDDARSNFMNVARDGLRVDVRWVNGKKMSVKNLLLKEIIPMARKGLEKANVDKADIDKYMGIIEARVKSEQTGSTWMLQSYSKLIKQTTKEEVMTAITVAIAAKQKSNQPIHTWKLASIEDISDWQPSDLLVEEFMDTDLFTVTEDDIPEFAADIMDWQRIRYLPVECQDGVLGGLVSSRLLLRHFKANQREIKNNVTTVKDLMITNVHTISPEANIHEAMDLMRKHKVGCLPVVANNNLVGIITEANFLNITASLLKRIAERRRKRKEQNEQNEQLKNTSKPQNIKDREIKIQGIDSLENVLAGGEEE